MYFQNTFVTIDNSQAPVMITTFADYDPSRAEFEAYLKAYESLCEKSDPFVLIFDASKSKNLRAELRVRQSKWLDQNRKLLQGKMKEGIFIIPSTFVRIILNGIFLMNKPPYTYTIVGNMEEAIKLAKTKI
ncbi:MAG: hypothetical protein H7Y04_09250 [Verrucomicrobia bacterium]|nr:hypothetical protein [Cytophagales bacterium]